MMRRILVLAVALLAFGLAGQALAGTDDVAPFTADTQRRASDTEGSEPGSWYRDTNGDSIPDTEFKDPDGDGFAEKMRDLGPSGVAEDGTPVYADNNDDGYFETVSVDTDGDGTYDTTYVDTTGNGAYDLTKTDQDQDGLYDTAERDIDGDGVTDRWAVDLDKDGLPDQWEADTNGDGNPDTLWVDFNGDNIRNDRSWVRDIDGDGDYDLTYLDHNGDGDADEIRSVDGSSREVDRDFDGVFEEQWVDVDGDGIIDHVFIDKDGDGVSETTFFDQDQDGVFDIAERDTNGDGLADEWAYDTDGDGQWDAWEWDTDGDGEADRSYFDRDNDGKRDPNWFTDEDGDGILDTEHIDRDGDGKADERRPLETIPDDVETNAFAGIRCEDIAEFIEPQLPDLGSDRYVIARLGGGESLGETLSGCTVRSYDNPTQPGTEVSLSILWDPAMHTGLPEATVTGDGVLQEDWNTNGWERRADECTSNFDGLSGLVYELDEEGNWVFRGTTPHFIRNYICFSDSAVIVGGLFISVSAHIGGHYCPPVTYSLPPNWKLEIYDSLYEQEPQLFEYFGPMAGPWCRPDTVVVEDLGLPYDAETLFTSSAEIDAEFAIQRNWMERVRQTITLPAWLFDEELARAFLDG